MQCDVRAVSDSDGRLHLRFGADGADWLHYVWSGQRIWLCSADGSRPVSVRRALKLLLREVWLREDCLRENWLREIKQTEVRLPEDQLGEALLSEPLAESRGGTPAQPSSRRLLPLGPQV